MNYIEPLDITELNAICDVMSWSIDVFIDSHETPTLEEFNELQHLRNIKANCRLLIDQQWYDAPLENCAFIQESFTNSDLRLLKSYITVAIRQNIALVGECPTKDVLKFMVESEILTLVLEKLEDQHYNLLTTHL